MESCLLKEASDDNTMYAFTVIDNFYEERKLRKAGELDELICPGCRRPVHLRYGKIIRPYFAHKSDETNHSCNYHEESMTHILGKEILYEYFRTKYPGVDIRFDYKLSIGRKPNLYCIFPDGNELAVEFQRSNMRVTEWEERNESYKNNGIKVLWILNFLDSEHEALQTSSFLNFFKQMVLHDSDNRLLLLNIDKKLLTISRGVEYCVLDRHYDLGLISRDYPLDEINIQTDGVIPCDLDGEYERQYQSLKDSIDKMLQDEENRKIGLEAEKNAELARLKEREVRRNEARKNQEVSGKAEQEDRVIERESLVAASRQRSENHPSREKPKKQGLRHKPYSENRKNMSSEENQRRMNTTKGLYADLVRQASKGDVSACEKVKRVYNQREDIRKLIDSIVEEDPKMEKVIMNIIF